MLDGFCPAGGWLVKGSLPVPDDPSDHDDGLSGAMVGCNRLRCSQCGEWVRNQRVWVDDAPAPETLYGADDWTTFDGIKPSPEFRFYACTCSSYQCVVSQPTLDPSRDDLTQEEPPAWLCQGHPDSTLPLSIDGHDVATVDDLPALAERVLTGWSPRGAPPPTNTFPAAWACRVLQRLPLGAAERWAGLIGAGLDGEERAVGLVLHLYALDPHAPGFEQLLDRAELVDPASLAATVRTWEGRSEDTSDADWQALLDLMGGEYGVRTSWLRPLLRRLSWAQLPLNELDVRAREVVRAAVLAHPGGLNSDALEALAAADGEWLAQQARLIVQAVEGGVEELLSALRAANREEPLILAGVAISKIGAKRRRELSAWLKGMPDRDNAYWQVLERAAKS